MNNKEEKQVKPTVSKNIPGCAWTQQGREASYASTDCDDKILSRQLLLLINTGECPPGGPLHQRGTGRRHHQSLTGKNPPWSNGTSPVAVINSPQTEPNFSSYPTQWVLCGNQANTQQGGTNKLCAWPKWAKEKPGQDEWVACLTTVTQTTSRRIFDQHTPT